MLCNKKKQKHCCCVYVCVCVCAICCLLSTSLQWKLTSVTLLKCLCYNPNSCTVSFMQAIKVWKRWDKTGRVDNIHRVIFPNYIWFAVMIVIDITEVNYWYNWSETSTFCSRNLGFINGFIILAALTGRVFCVYTRQQFTKHVTVCDSFRDIWTS